jgi:hypothetical protein
MGINNKANARGEPAGKNNDKMLIPCSLIQIILMAIKLIILKEKVTIK